jgi:PAS domain S-box-containing protein
MHKPERLNLRQLWQQLAIPAAPAQDPDRRRAQMLVALLVVLAPLGILIAALPPLLSSQRSILEDAQFRLAVSASVFVLVLYWLSRTRYYKVTALLTIIVASLAVLLASISEIGVDYDTLFYLVLPTLLGSIFLTLSQAAIILFINVTGLLLLPMLSPAVSLTAIVSEPLSFVVVTSGAVLLTGYFRNRMEEDRQHKLATSEERFSKIFHASPVAIGIRTLDDGLIVDANKHTLDLLGYRRDELVGRHVSEVNVGSEVQSRAELIAAIDEKGFASFETQWRAKSGKLLDVLTSAVTIELDGIPCVLGMGVDITHIKQAERERRERERIAVELRKERELGEIKRRFMTTAAHEFRTPLSIILASSELLELYRERMSPESLSSNFATIRAQVMALGAMLDDMRTILDVEAGSVEFDPAPCDLARLCREIVGEMQSLQAAKHTLVFSSEGDLAGISVDRDLFERIVKNLVSNAIKFSPVGSEVRVSVSRRGDRVTLTVSDQGMGIPLKDQARIFDSSFRAENAINIPGIGLGLKIVQEYVRLHNGTITFTSEEEKGTTLTVTLPVQTASIDGKPED